MNAALGPTTPQKALIYAGWLIDGQGCAPLADQMLSLKAGRILSIETAPKGAPEELPINLNGIDTL